MLNLRTGSRGFSSGSGFGFRGHRASDSDTLSTYFSLVSNSIHALQITHFSHIRIFIHTHHAHTLFPFFLNSFSFFFEFQQLYLLLLLFFFNEDVEVNELEDLSRRFYESVGQYYCSCLLVHWFVNYLCQNQIMELFIFVVLASILML